MTNFKSILCVGLSFGVFAVAFAAVDKTIAARGAKVPNNADANVRITSAGSGGNNTLGATHTSVLSLKQETTTASTLRILNGELFSVDLLSILSGKSALTVGDAVGVGTVESLTGRLTLDNASSSASLTLNANVSVPTNVIAKTGSGSVVVRGAMVGDVDQRAGVMSYYAGDAYAASYLTVSGGNPLFYGVATRYADLAQLKTDGRSSQSADGGVRESVLTTAGVYPLNELQVGGSNVVRLAKCDFRQLEVTEDHTYWYDEVPECVLVGADSAGVLKLEGGSLYGKIALGAGAAKGVLFIDGGADVCNYCSTTGEVVFGRSGYSYLEVAGGSTNAMYGYWAGGSSGQLAIVVTNGVFAHAAADVRPCGFSLRGADSALLIGTNGLFAAVDPLRAAEIRGTASASVVEGGVFDIGNNVLSVFDEAAFAVHAGGVLCAAGVRPRAETAIAQFDGGRWRLPEGEIPESRILVQKGGVQLEVPFGATAKITGSDMFRYPSGSVVASISAGSDENVYLGPPVVGFRSGSFGGHGASAVCEWDRSTGKVTGIRVTGAGTGYQPSRVSAFLRYGDVERPLEVTLSDAQGGEVVKTGGGVLELAGSDHLLKLAVVREGVLKIGSAGALNPESAIRVDADAVLDLGGNAGTNDVMVSGYSCAGTGIVQNGLLTLTGLVCDFDVQTNQVCKLDMDHLCFAPTATVKIQNVKPDLDRNKGYELYRLEGAASRGPVAMPPLDASTTDVLTKAWGLVVEERIDEYGAMYKVAVLRYLGGSLFIYY